MIHDARALSEEDLKAVLVELYISHGDRAFDYSYKAINDSAELEEMGYVEWLYDTHDDTDTDTDLAKLTPKALDYIKES